MKVKILKACEGDCILIDLIDKENNNRNILIDGGISKTYQFKNAKGKTEAGDLQLAIRQIRNNSEMIDLLILTHVDDDHIGGILKWFENDLKALDLVGEIWFNSGRLIANFFKENEAKENLLPVNIPVSNNTSIKQGVNFEDYIQEGSKWRKDILAYRLKLERFGITFNFLSPNEDKLKFLLKKWEKEEPVSLTSKKVDYNKTLKELLIVDKFEEDNAIHNGSSIAFTMTFNGKNLLFLADAHPSTIVASLAGLEYSKEKLLEAELVKIAHHGSKANNSQELLEMIRCDRFVISSNGEKHGLPNKQFLARLISIHNNCEIYFNYPDLIDRIFLEQDFRDFPKFKALPINSEFNF